MARPPRTKSELYKNPGKLFERSENGAPRRTKSKLYKNPGKLFERSENGAPGKIRTPNLLIRSQVLYPIELRARRRGGSR